MNRKVIIIGASSGIGAELAKLYIQSGDTVGISGRRGYLLDEFQKQFPSQIVIESFDVTGSENIRHLESLIQKLGGLDVLIYNAGFGDISQTLDWSIDKQTTLTNVNGFLEIVNYGFNYFLKQGAGHIVATSSVAAIRGSSHAPAYSASKAFMSNYMEGLYFRATRLRRNDPKLNIVVTDIQPGFVNTKRAKGKVFWQASTQKASKQIFAAIKKKRVRVYVTRRWAIIVWLLKWLPPGILKKFA